MLTPFGATLNPTDNYHAEWLIGVDDWIQENLQTLMIQDGFNPGFNMDFTNTFISGHSSGAHVIVNYLRLGCFNIKGLILLSPVDGVDPFGFINEYCITPGEKLNFETPTLVLIAGLDSVPGDIQTSLSSNTKTILGLLFQELILVYLHVFLQNWVTCDFGTLLMVEHG